VVFSKEFTFSREVSPERVLLGYSYYAYSVDIRVWVEKWLARLRNAGFCVDGFCLTLNPPGPRLSWRELEYRYRKKDRALFSMYDELLTQMRDYDIFVNWNGINLHPKFVQQLPIFSVYACYDDPESSADLSQPVAWAYDLCMVGNIAALDMYRSWGVKNAYFWPLGFRADEYDPSLTRERILDGQRDIDIVLLCERKSPWRQKRLSRFAASFPQGAFYGEGWPHGFLPEGKRVPLLQRSKLGINLHNSTGPVNFRTYYLPANGVLQICDNKAYLGKIFELDREVIGFETVEEAIDLCRYYLAHDAERREVAAAGWERAVRDYNEISTFKLVLDCAGEIRMQSERHKIP
jgi:hypothetical protein